MSFLFKPFPAPKNGPRAALPAAGFGLFVACFLWVFRPFGLDNLGNDLWWVAASYGAITTAVMLLMRFAAPTFIPGTYEENHWTTGKEIGQTMATILLIAAGNMLFSVWMGFFSLSATAFFVFLGFTFAVGLFPVAIGILVRQNAYHKKYMAGSAQINRRVERPLNPNAESRTEIAIRDENDRNILSIAASELLAITSADNYIKVFYISDEGTSTEMIRAALNTVEASLSPHPQFFRVHRSWLVSLSHVAHVEGNARGYQIRVNGVAPKIPVARSRIEAFDAAFSSKQPTG